MRFLSLLLTSRQLQFFRTAATPQVPKDALPIGITAIESKMEVQVVEPDLNLENKLLAVCEMWSEGMNLT